MFEKYIEEIKKLGIVFSVLSNGEFIEKMGMFVKKNNFGFGSCFWRYFMYVKNGVIKKMFVEKGMKDNAKDDPFAVSDADTMLTYLKTV
jgi:peroxiredoxin